MAEQQPRGGGGYDEPIPEPAQPEPGINPEENIMPDQSETWDQVVTQANSQNLKRFVEQRAELSHNKASQQASLQDQPNSRF